jgi:hypothetical protein
MCESGVSHGIRHRTRPCSSGSAYGSRPCVALDPSAEHSHSRGHTNSCLETRGRLNTGLDPHRKRNLLFATAGPAPSPRCRDHRPDGRAFSRMRVRADGRPVTDPRTCLFRQQVSAHRAVRPSYAGRGLNGVALAVHESEPALDLTAAITPLRDPGVAVWPGTPHERSGAVSGAALRARHCCSLCFGSRHLVVPPAVPLRPEVASTPSN